jgi:hypothetical protein
MKTCDSFKGWFLRQRSLSRCHWRYFTDLSYTKGRYNADLNLLQISKGKLHSRTGHKRPEGESRYSFTLSLTSALDGVGDQRHSTAALRPGKARYQLYRRLNRPQGRSGTARKFSPTPGVDLRTVQPVANLYTDWDIPTHILGTITSLISQRPYTGRHLIPVVYNWYHAVARIVFCLCVLYL